MSMFSRFRQMFPQPAVDEGRRDYLNDNVVNMRISNGSITAIVKGPERHDVVLTMDGIRLKVRCTCQSHRSKGRCCRHIVAVIEAASYGNFRLFDRIRHVAADTNETAAPELAWNRSLRMVGAAQRQELVPPPPQPRDDSWYQLFYVANVDSTLESGEMLVELQWRKRKKNGEWSKLREPDFRVSAIAEFSSPADRLALRLIAGAGSRAAAYYYYDGDYDAAVPDDFPVKKGDDEALLPAICATGRFVLAAPADGSDEYTPLAWDDGPAWTFALQIAACEDNPAEYEITGQLRRGEESRPLSEPRLLLDYGFAFWKDRVSRFDSGNGFSWVRELRGRGPIRVPAAQAEDVMTGILSLPFVPPIDCRIPFTWTETTSRPARLARITKNQSYGRELLSGQMIFDYDGVEIDGKTSGNTVYQPESRTLCRRDVEAEREALAQLGGVGFNTRHYHERGGTLVIDRAKLPSVVQGLLAAGWRVEAEGGLYRLPGQFRMSVTSGIDWFDLEAQVDFGGIKATLPELLAALRSGQKFVRLGDGSFGMLPEEWMRKYAPLAGTGEVEGQAVRFRRSQASLLDALLAAQPEVRVDRAFAHVRQQIASFAGVKPADPPKTFTGTLREYQRAGLGWLGFLRDFSLGGCLADDMGLGKTVQMLAMLEERRQARARRKGENRPAASLAVVPKSLVFNWISEAGRFTPRLRVLDYTGAGRKGADFDEYDLVLTTYGTLLRDAETLSGYTFDYVILDEAQAIKNAATATAKAARLLKGRHRLAMSGTPIENHLGELWSLFEFLNPGFLGTAAVFKSLTSGGAASPEGRELLARAIRPFVLRRTKAQVAKDLPEKTEQTIYCDLDPKQRKLYNELRDHYRLSLLGRIGDQGINRSKIQILEALLRLRQAAIHPGLIDAKRVKEPGAKLELLLGQISEVIDEGHKTLVFSQFTSMLGIVRERLDERGIGYEYLDGQTLDRARRVEKFQTDPECRLFLISLKAGGLGLNLTAAEYVFLLDPWWNPAVESQAIDRAHRIGQEKPVFAYRLIARDTVEEKVLALQETKRDLADSIIRADDSLLRTLSVDDLRLLLS